MRWIRAVTMTVLLSFLLVASAAGAFIYLLSGYPSPQVQTFYVQTNDTAQGLRINSNATIRNLGGQGEVKAQFRLLENGRVIESREQAFAMARNDTRVVKEEFTGEGFDDVGLAVFAPGRPELIQDRSEVLERIQ